MAREERKVEAGDGAVGAKRGEKEEEKEKGRNPPTPCPSECTVKIPPERNNEIHPSIHHVMTPTDPAHLYRRRNGTSIHSGVGLQRKESHYCRCSLQSATRTQDMG